MEWIFGLGLVGMLFFVALPLALAVWAIVDLANQPMDPVMKLLWVVLILVFPIVGPIASLIINRPERRRV
jgi:hypothetical protein